MLKGWIIAAIVIVVWGMTFASTRVLLVDFSALEILVVRFALAWMTLALLSAFRPRPGARGWRDELLCAAMGFTGVFAYQFLENCAIYYTNASNVAILVSFGPIVTASMARAFTRDRSLTLTMVVGSLVAVCGVALVSMNGAVNFHLRPLGDAMALVAMFSWGAYSLLLDRANARGIPPLTAIRKAFFWSLAMMLPVVWWGATDAGYYALDGSFSVTTDWAANGERFARVGNLAHLVFLGVLASATCFALWSAACKRLGMVRTTIGLYLTPVVGVLFAALFLDERLTGMSAIGGGMILLGVACANWRIKR